MFYGSKGEEKHEEQGENGNLVEPLLDRSMENAGEIGHGFASMSYFY
jgi:hypothetical protein